MTAVMQCDQCGATTPDTHSTWWTLNVPSHLVGFVPNRVDLCSNKCIRAWVEKEAWDGRDDRITKKSPKKRKVTV